MTLVCLSLVGLCRSVAPAAELEFQRLFPPAVTAGVQTTITAEGKFPTWPVSIDCDRSDLTISCDPASGKLQVVVPASTPPGIAWLRLYDLQSASGLVPLLIESDEVRLESEPNGALDESTRVSLPLAVVGKLEKSADVDGVKFALRADETLVATVIANQILRSDMDSVLQITDSLGHVLAQSDDERGLDPQLVFKADESQDIVLRLFAFPETPNSTIGFAGSASYTYLLRASVTKVADHFLPLAAGNSTRAATASGWNIEDDKIQWTAATDVSPPVASILGAQGWQWIAISDAWGESFIEGDPSRSVVLPAVFSGHIASEGEIDRFRFQALAGRNYRAEVQSQVLGYTLDSVLKVVAPDSQTAIASNDDGSRNQYDAAIEFAAKSDGELELQVSDLASSASLRHAYSVHMFERTPRVTASVTSDRFVVKPSAEVEITVAIDRLDGFASKLRIDAIELPAAVSAEPVFSEAKGESAKSVKLRLKAEDSAAAFQGPFRIQVVEAEPSDPKSASSNFAHFELRPQVRPQRLWLTVPASDESLDAQESN